MFVHQPLVAGGFAVWPRIEVEELKKKAKRVGPAFKPKTQLLGGSDGRHETPWTHQFQHGTWACLIFEANEKENPPFLGMP